MRSNGRALVLLLDWQAAATTFEQVSAAAKRLTDASGARAATQFLVQIVADGAVMTSNAISQTVALKRWWR